MGDLNLEKNKTGQFFNVQLVSATDGSDITTGSPAVQVTKDGAAMAAIAGTIAHQANGSWQVAPTAEDTNFDRGAYSITLAGALSVTMNTDTTVLSLADIYGDGLITGLYRWDTAVTATDPGAGNVKANNATYSLITQVYISATSDKGLDVSAALRQLQVGDFIVIADNNDTTKFFDGTVSGAVVDNTGWFTVPLSYRNSGDTISNNRQAAVGLYFDRSAWTDAEKDQFRYRLQLDGTQTAPAVDAPAQFVTTADKVNNDVDGNVAGSVGSVTDPVSANVTNWQGVPVTYGDSAYLGALTVTTNNDKTGYSISGTKTTLDALNDITAAAVLAAGDIDGRSLEQALKIIGASAAGVLAGAATSNVTVKGLNNSATTRITATVDADGNRSAVTENIT